MKAQLYFELVPPSSSPNTKLGFSGHETFPFRYGWLPKAVMGAINSPVYFSQPLALVGLGVGKNMVQSIRHWGRVTGLLHEAGKGIVEPTELGRKLYEEWDPYLEDIGSLWLIHWKLVNNLEAATWYFVFFGYSRRDFTKAELTQHLADWAERSGSKHKLSTLERDVDCLLRTYLPAKTGKRAIAEDTFDCPLVELGLLQAYADGKRYGFVFGAKRTLPTSIFAYALIEFLQGYGERQTVPVHDVLFVEGSPGQAFKLDENALIEQLELVQTLTKEAIALDHTAGLKQLYLREKVDKWKLLEQFYGGQV